VVEGPSDLWLEMKGEGAVRIGTLALISAVAVLCWFVEGATAARSVSRQQAWGQCMRVVDARARATGYNQSRRSRMFRACMAQKGHPRI
jgi:hypothetical protein